MPFIISSDALVTSSFLLLVARPGLLVAMPGAPSSVLSFRSMPPMIRQFLWSAGPAFDICFNTAMSGGEWVKELHAWSWSKSARHDTS